MNDEKLTDLIAENKKLKLENAALLEELKHCHNDISDGIATVLSIKKELRRYDVQINSLTAENNRFKQKFDKIENNPIGKLMLKVYRKFKKFQLRRR